jgi:hypothetical protein
MEKLNSFRSPMKELGNVNVVTSTPHLKSDIGKELVKRHFIKNFPRDLSVSMLEEKISKLTINLNIGNTNQSPEFKPFVFKKIQDSSDQVYAFRTPKTISPETIEKYNKLFDNSPKFTRKRIRL